MSEQVLEQQFREAVRAAVPGVKRAAEEMVAPGISAGLCVELFESQVTSRQLDLAARRLGRAGRGFYSIGSSGHEGNAALAIATRVDDPALLHYRSGAFFVQRARRVPGLDPIRDVLLGVVAAAADPISGGRHKVFGSKPAAVIPQTSTIASHLPRAVGLAFALERGVRLGVPREWPQDAVVLCTFGDASANHSTAAGAINAAVHTAHLGVGLPILFVCEDNGIGISVPTPPDWIATAYGQRRGLRYFDADGCDLLDALTAATEAVHWVRTHRAPAFLRLRTVRLLGHAGSDVETAYRASSAIAADAACDPVTATARMLITVGISTPDEVLARYDAIAEQVAAVAEELSDAPKLTSATQVMAPLAPAHPDLVRADVQRGTAHPHAAPGDAETPAPAAAPGRAETPGPASPTSSEGPSEPGVPGQATASAPGLGPQHDSMPDGENSDALLTSSHPQTSTEPSAAEHIPLTLAQGINHTLRALLARDNDLLVFGEDVARKGGVYGVTKGLRKEFGARRVFDTLLDEQSVLGSALGAGLAGFVPIPEIQYLAYVHNALDQLRGEAATLQFFSEGRYRNPMVVRVAGLAYQRGFGGHFHNDNSVAALRDIPGLVVAVPARADDAAALLRTCVSAARVDGRVCVIVEPIALYHRRDLYESGDDGWLAPAAAPWHVPIGRARTYGDGTDLTIVTFGNGVPMSLRVARRLAARGVDARVLDLRWLAPLPHDDLLHHAEITGRVLVADETRRSGGVSESVYAALLDAGFTGRLARVTSADSFVPLGPAAATVLLDETAIESAAVELVKR